MRFTFHHQLDAMDCGAACLRMVAEYHGRRYSLQQLRQRTHLDREGVSARGIVVAAEGIGLRPLPITWRSQTRAGLCPLYPQAWWIVCVRAGWRVCVRRSASAREDRR